MHWNWKQLSLGVKRLMRRSGNAVGLGGSNLILDVLSKCHFERQKPGSGINRVEKRKRSYYCSDCNDKHPACGGDRLPVRRKNIEKSEAM
jgi:hypothetical protein